MASGASSFSLRILRTGFGVLGTIEQFVSLEYVLVENDFGALTLTLPDTFPQDWFTTDTIIEVYRTIDDVTTLEGETIWFVRDTSIVLTPAGEWFFQIVAFDAKHLLKRRIVDGHAGSPLSAQTGPADNTMRQIVREQLGASAPSDVVGPRQIIGVEPNAALYQSISKAFAWRNVLEVLKDIASEMALTEHCAFHVVKDNAAFNGLEFRIRRGAWGVNHGQASATPIVFTPENGGLFDVSILFDTRDEVNVVRIGGQGEGALRVLAFGYSLFSAQRSAWNRIEAFVDARNTSTSSELISDGFAYFSQRLARYKFTGKVQQTAELKYGVHYKWGDIVVASARGFTFDVHLKTVHVTANANGETIDIGVSAEKFLLG